MEYKMESKGKMSGFTLVELMISLVLGTIVISGLISVYVSTVTSSNDTLAMSKLSQQTSALMNIITSDVRRAGYWGQGAMSLDNYINRDPAINPFSTSSVSALALIDNIAGNNIIAGNSNSVGDCLVYTYDADDDGILDNEDIVGFRISGIKAQMKRLGNNGDARHDSCVSGTWEDLTDSEVISVDALEFTLENSVCLNTREPDGIDNDAANGIDDDAEIDCYVQAPTAASGDVTVETLQIQINITASLVNDSAVKVQMSQIVRVRNDRVRTW